MIEATEIAKTLAPCTCVSEFESLHVNADCPQFAVLKALIEAERSGAEEMRDYIAMRIDNALPLGVTRDTLEAIAGNVQAIRWPVKWGLR